MFIESIERLHARLRDYIEAVYHIADDGILAQRRELLERAGVLRQPAFIESTRTYAPGPRYEDLLAPEPQPLRELTQRLSTRQGKLLHDPPYLHQGEALRALLGAEQRDIVVYTGTGSGKTECFTVPTLLRTYREAVLAPASFGRRAVRALVLYPMNALVNDQLSRMRKLLGDDDVARAFSAAAGRPMTFGQYTGRTPFPGLRDYSAAGDGARIKAFEDFYLNTVELPARRGDADAIRLKKALTDRGRWPAKEDLLRWFGESGARWDKRLHPQPGDRELVARHEFYGYAVGGKRYGGPPDVLVTNYSMLEYMLLRPVERPIFEETREWLAANREQTFFLVLDEAHLYRGAQGTEVALLIRRLLERLDLLRPERAGQLRIAVTSASFSSGDAARAFASGLVGQPTSRFVPIGGTLGVSAPGSRGSRAEAERLAGIDLAAFYGETSPQKRFDLIRGGLEAVGGDLRGAAPQSLDELAAVAHRALVDAPLRRQMVALTQQEALQLPELAAQLFPEADPENGLRASAVLAALCSFARPSPGEANLLPSRIHTFHRGLPGLWACVSPACRGGGAIGELYAQPRDRCDRCDARVFPLFTCRLCGAAYARAAALSSAVEDLGAGRVDFLWGSGKARASDGTQVLPVDMLLDPDRADPALASIAWLDPHTGLVASRQLPEPARRVGLYRIDKGRNEPSDTEGRLFFQCGICGDNNDKARDAGALRRSPVEDHQTEGQDPFYALVHEQLTQQPPRPARPAFLKTETPLRGRKVLIFSDGRQKAARLAAELGRASLRDGIRPLVLAGYRARPAFSLRDAYAALLVGAVTAGVDLRATDEKIDEELARHLSKARETSEEEFEESLLRELQGLAPAAPIATLLMRVLRDKHTGLSALALARLEPKQRHLKKIDAATSTLGELPEGFRRPLLSLWLGLFFERKGSTIFAKEALEEGAQWLAASPHSGNFDALLSAVGGAWGANAKAAMQRSWLPAVRDALRSDDDNEGSAQISLHAVRLSLVPVDASELGSWGRCARCSRVQCAVLPGGGCVHCGASGVVEALAPGSAARARFEKRKGFYRGAVLDRSTALRPLVAREHSAALTGATGETQSRAERHELAFQDITARTIDGMRSAIDVLSCTTTMEVGIDIGDLSAVALRNMPPGRANYQQRAGRAGRRGNAVATVLAFADQDGHNQHSFENPRRQIKDPVPDPRLNLQNYRIARRHVTAFVLQRFLAVAAPGDAGAAGASLKGSLGTVRSFLSPEAALSLERLRAWLRSAVVVSELRAAIDRWLPADVNQRSALLEGFATAVVEDLERALASELGAAGGDTSEADTAEAEDTDAEGTSPTESLLDRLLYEGALPKYAFPTDLVAFHVFEATNGLGSRASDVRAKVRYAPQRGLSLALSEYAPGRTVFIDGRVWFSGGLYSPVKGLVSDALRSMVGLRYCEVCGFATRVAKEGGDPLRGGACPACGDAKIGANEPTSWLRPPGFAHPVSARPRTEPDAAGYSRPGRAVLNADNPEPGRWQRAPDQPGVKWLLNTADDQTWEVLITNRGPQDRGFRVCKRCHSIEPIHEGGRLLKEHKHPAPAPSGFSVKCEAPDVVEPVFLGTSFRTDVLLLRFEVPPPQRLSPGLRVPAFQVASSSLATALAQAASLVLEVEGGEVVAGYRPGFDAQSGSSVEVFLYDQLAGGAGYVVELAERMDELLGATRAILSHGEWSSRLPAPPCDRACYGCLLSFKNSYEHATLDRHLALDLLDCARSGRPARVSSQRSRSAYSVIRRWVETIAEVEVLDPSALPSDAALRGAPLLLRARAGHLVAPALAHPFSEGIPDDEALAGAAEFPSDDARIVPLNYLDVASAFPAAMEILRRALS